ncbi:hypothetical protein Zmor_024721 [Zophobas morio]|uniref:Uncharacterized protein n=1 Tax=Zophobas morio TaxID=2755281 RepID=A0AA38I5B1_9CUCU|nr:hypothetical protein Zmor_024721 [Zophobas morio]
MWSLCVVYFLISSCLADTSSLYFFCADMNHQIFVNIEQLMGMWYGIEIINHNSEQHYVRMGNSCPILHISEDKDYPITTYNPLYKNYNYGYNYGERRVPTDRPTQHEYDQYGRPIQNPYDRNYYNRRFGTTKNPNRRERQYDMKRIRIWWDENGAGTEYHLRYNTSRPGFWISSGPQNGSELEPQYSDFAGTVQVIKAVGNHLVLTFCHRLPEKQLFTVLLSRDNKLGQPEIHSVHNLLNRRGLSANAVKKVCWNGGENIKIPLATTLLVSVLSLLLLRF